LKTKLAKVYGNVERNNERLYVVSKISWGDQFTIT